MKLPSQTAIAPMSQEHNDRTHLALAWIGGVLLLCATLLFIAHACFDYSQGVIRLSRNSYLRIQGPLLDLMLPMACLCLTLGVAALIYSRLRHAG